MPSVDHYTNAEGKKRMGAQKSKGRTMMQAL